MRGRLLSAAALLVLVSFWTVCVAQSQGETTKPFPWVLVWDENFEGPAGTQPTSSRWTFDLGNRAFGNHELQYYTDDNQNIRLDGQGHLEIRALESQGDTDQLCWTGKPCPYTSGRLTTLGKLGARYGKLEARIKVPPGRGLLPAFWAMGDTGQGWPDNGEIDIMEVVGQQPNTIHGTVHGPGYVGIESLSGQKRVAKPLASDFHVFTLLKRPRELVWLLDGKAYHRVTPADLPEDTTWVFDEPFYLIINLAVGGDWPKTPPHGTLFPKIMLIDYVRVWDRQEKNE